jgi:predicted ArsR family transcriptional regulator
LLSGILRLLDEREGALSVQEISLALGIDSSALRPMLEMLEQKGRVQKVTLPCKKACAGGCTESDSMTFYKMAASGE